MLLSSIEPPASDEPHKAKQSQWSSRPLDRFNRNFGLKGRSKLSALGHNSYVLPPLISDWIIPQPPSYTLVLNSGSIILVLPNATLSHIVLFLSFWFQRHFSQKNHHFSRDTEPFGLSDAFGVWVFFCAWAPTTSIGFQRGCRRKSACHSCSFVKKKGKNDTKASFISGSWCRINLKWVVDLPWFL